MTARSLYSPRSDDPLLVEFPSERHSSSGTSAAGGYRLPLDIDHAMCVCVCDAAEYGERCTACSDRPGNYGIVWVAYALLDNTVCAVLMLPCCIGVCHMRKI